MGLSDKLRQAGNSLRNLWLSPNSYSKYRRDRKQASKQAGNAREDAEDSAELEREKAERKRGYEARYTREREGDSR
jgi:hypothetical protein